MSDDEDVFDAMLTWASRARSAQQAMDDLGVGRPAVSRETSPPEEVLADMREKFGEEESAHYIKLAKAMRSITFLWRTYVRTPDGSYAEAMIGATLERMLDQIKTHPDHAAGLIEGLIALVEHLRMGGTYEDWFLSIGISPVPEKGESNG